MDYLEIVELVPSVAWDQLLDKLIKFVLTSKNEGRMTNRLADTILYKMKNGLIKSRDGLSTVLEAAFVLEPEKTIGAFDQLQLESIVKKMKEKLSS